MRETLQDTPGLSGLESQNAKCASSTYTRSRNLWLFCWLPEAVRVLVRQRLRSPVYKVVTHTHTHVYTHLWPCSGAILLTYFFPATPTPTYLCLTRKACSFQRPSNAMGEEKAVCVEVGWWARMLQIPVSVALSTLPAKSKLASNARNISNCKELFVCFYAQSAMQVTLTLTGKIMFNKITIYVHNNFGRKKKETRAHTEIMLILMGMHILMGQHTFCNNNNICFIIILWLSHRPIERELCCVISVSYELFFRMLEVNCFRTFFFGGGWGGGGGTKTPCIYCLISGVSFALLEQPPAPNPSPSTNKESSLEPFTCLDHSYSAR